MRTRHRLQSLAGGACALLLAALPLGCEDTPSDRGARTYFDEHPYESESRESSVLAATFISPAAAHAESGSHIAFQALGGLEPFTWSVSNPAKGTIIMQSNSRFAIYIHTGGTNDINYVLLNDSQGELDIADIN